MLQMELQLRFSTFRYLFPLWLSFVVLFGVTRARINNSKVADACDHHVGVRLRLRVRLRLCLRLRLRLESQDSRGHTSS
jgi:hypothetical protein